jgi:uncharacterized protein YecT (DUF1311 family)
MKITFYIFCMCSQFTFCQTQTEMNLSAAKELKQSDSRIISLMTKIENERKEDTLFISNLRKSQTAWLNWRELEINAYFPAYENEEKGTMYSWCYNTQILKWNKARINQLKEYLLDASDFEDGCSPGSW